MWFLPLFALAGCGDEPQRDKLVRNASAPPAAAPSASPVTSTTPAPKAKPPTSLAEPKGPIDSKSVEAAGQVVQHYGALIEQGRWKEAAAYWGDPLAARTFAKELQKLRLIHLQIGELSDSEGAAGSIYVNMFVTFAGPDTKWGPSGRHANVILRRVNDVPGSTESQRRWHIERIEWLPMA